MDVYEFALINERNTAMILKGFFLRLLPIKMQLKIIHKVANRPSRPVVRENELLALNSAKPMPYVSKNGTKCSGWVWGEGPTIVLVHGWGGRAAQMAPLAEYLSTVGFKTVVFDVSGHGDSSLPEARWEYFARDIEGIQKIVGSVFAFIGHSAGGLTMMAAQNLNRITADKFVCICAPSHPFPPIQFIQKNVQPSPRVLDLYRTYLGNQLGVSWEKLEAGQVFQNCDDNLLLCYDKKDRFIAHEEGDRIHSLCPQSTLNKTSQYGHGRILSAPDVMQGIGRFLLADEKSKVSKQMASTN